MHSPRTLAVALAAALAAVLPVAAGASPARADTPADASGTLLLMVSGPGAGTLDGTVRAAVLDCAAPPAGDHPHAAAACSALAASGGDPAALPGRPGLCPDIVRPVTAAAAGSWNGDAVLYRRTYPNRCLLLRATGALFDF